jgi:hypothetical protein
MVKSVLNKKWIVDEDDTFIGVCLGVDFNVKHESGILGIRTAFGMKSTGIENKLLGIIKKEVPAFGATVRKINENVASFFKESDTYILGYTKGNPEYLRSYASFRSSDIFDAYWDPNSFVLISNDDNMKVLWSAFMENDILIFSGGISKLNVTGGLNILIKSKCPKSVLSDMERSDRDAYELNKRLSETKIIERLNESGCACKEIYPQFNRIGNTSTVVFWIDPVDRKKYKSGWFNENDLEDCIKGIGPIIKNNKDEKTS